MTDVETYERFWQEAGISLLHPTQLLILEALARLGFPISATAMERICDRQIPVQSFSYHMRRLEDLDLIELVRKEPRRGATERFYRLRSPR